MARKGQDPIGFPDAETTRQIVVRASASGFESWWAKVAAAGHCSRPVRLTRTTPDGRTETVMVRCKDRRASVCRSCSALYMADTWHLVHAGLAGGQGIARTVAGHPSVFVTLTAPSFGAVHSKRNGADGDAARPCHPGGPGECDHGRSTRCGIVHDDGDDLVATPLCPECYDYLGQALTTWHAPQLWHRFTIRLRRLVRSKAGQGVRVSFVKIMEMQARGVPHYHAVIRLDAANADGGPKHPGPGIDGEELAVLVRQAAVAVHLEVPAFGGEVRSLCFGDLLDIQLLTHGDEDRDGTAKARRIAGYVAKYLSKSTADFGLSPRRVAASSIEVLNVSEHVRCLLRVVVALSEDTPGEYAGMTAWPHTLGYRGHASSKARRYSTTMTALRERRADYERAARRLGGDDASTQDVEWAYDSVGHRSSGERFLAESAAVKRLEEAWTARQFAEVSSRLAPLLPAEDGGAS